MAAPTFVADYQTVFNTGTWPKTVSVTTSVGDVLVAAVTIDEWGGSVDDVLTPTGGTNLTWTLQQFQQTTLNSAVWVFTATATTAETFTFSVNLNGGGAFGGVDVTRWSGSDGIGNTAESQQAAGNAPSTSLTTAFNNSAIVAFYGDWSETSPTGHTWRTINGIAPASGSGELYVADVSGHAVYYGAYWSDAGTAGAKTAGLSSPTMKPTGVAVEVRGSTPAGSTRAPAVVAPWPRTQPAGSAATLTPRTDPFVAPATLTPVPLVVPGRLARPQAGTVSLNTPRTEPYIDPPSYRPAMGRLVVMPRPGSASVLWAPRSDPAADFPPVPRPMMGVPTVLRVPGATAVLWSPRADAPPDVPPAPRPIIAGPGIRPQAGSATLEMAVAEDVTVWAPAIAAVRVAAPPRATAGAITLLRVTAEPSGAPAPPVHFIDGAISGNVIDGAIANTGYVDGSTTTTGGLS